jgi:hypothetical protein
MRELAEMQGFVRYLEEARKLQECERDEAERERDGWKKYEAAVDAKMSAQVNLAMYFILALNAVACVAVTVIQLIRWLL